MIELFVSQLFRHRTGFGLTTLKRANNSMAQFLTDLFFVMDQRLVCDLIDNYLEKLDIGKDSVLLEFKINFLTIVFDNENILDLCTKMVRQQTQKQNFFYQDGGILHNSLLLFSENKKFGGKKCCLFFLLSPHLFSGYM